MANPLHVWFYGMVFRVSGSIDAISGLIKSRMAAGHHLEKLGTPASRGFPATARLSCLQTD